MSSSQQLSEFRARPTQAAMGGRRPQRLQEAREQSGLYPSLSSEMSAVLERFWASGRDGRQ